MPDLRYISFGAGVQSTALLIASVKGLHGIPRADVAIFADTQGEPAWVYEQVERMRAWSPIPIETVTAGNLGQQIVDRNRGLRRSASSLPFYFRGTSGRSTILNRGCTRDFKIRPIEREVRKRLGYEKRQRIKRTADAMIGISLDEAHRMKPSRTAWVRNTYPLVDAGLTRNDCLSIVEAEGLPMPRKSACVYCPFHSDDYWSDLKRDHPEEWDKAVEWDRAFRDATSGFVKGERAEVFLHPSLLPLERLDLEAPQLFSRWGNECEGVCGV